MGWTGYGKLGTIAVRNEDSTCILRRVECRWVLHEVEILILE